MKKLSFLLLTLFVVTMVASSQNGERYIQEERRKESVGVSIDYGSCPNAVGFGVRYQHLFGNHIRIAPNFTYYSSMNEKQGWNLCADAHYLFPMKYERLKVYPIAGVSVLSMEYKEGDKAGLSKSGFGVNTGGGIQCTVLKYFAVFGEIKYQFTTEVPDQLAISAGLLFKF